MNESDNETILYRAAEAEMRRLHALRDATVAERQRAMTEVTPVRVDVGAAMVARAMAGDAAGAHVVLQTASHAVGHVEYLSTLIRALDGQIETMGFRVTDLMAAAIAANEPRASARREAEVAEQLRMFGAFKDTARLPNLSDDFTARDSHSR